MGGLIIGILLIVVGISALTGINFFHFIVAAILIAIGVRLLMRHSYMGPRYWEQRHHGNGTSNSMNSNVSSEDKINEVIVFSPLNKTINSEHFAGGKIVMVFSGGELDLSQVKTDRAEIDLEVSSVFSSIEIIIPKDWKVRTSAAAFLAHVDTHQAQGGTGNVTLVIRGDAVFGEIEVRN